MAGVSGVWAPFKELADVVNSAIAQKRAEAYYSLEAILKKHKPDFISLLQNPAKNPSHRSKVQRATKEGIQTFSLPTIHTLPQDFVEEALILSDILELNELSAVELLLAGEQQQPRFPDLTRGLVAVLLYHDGRRSLVSALRSLIQAREGVQWTLGLSGAVVTLVTSFTDQLFADGLVDKVLALLDSINVEKEMERLGKGRAIGSARHRQQLVEMIEEQRSGLADCLFYWACQSPLPKEVVLKLLGYLQRIKLETPDDAGSSKEGSSPPPPLPMVILSLLHTLFSSLTIGEPSPEASVDDSLLDEHYPASADPTFLPTIHAELLKDSGWGSPLLHATVKFAWAVLLRECSSRAAFAGITELEDDEGLMDQAIAGGAVQFLRQCVVASPHFHQEEYYVQRLHWIITSFIVNMPLKVKELRNYGDEVAREMLMRAGEGGALSSSRRRDFEEFMRLIGDLYSSDPNNLTLSLEYWTPTVEGDSLGGIRHRVPQRQISLFKFIHLCSDLLPAPLFVPLLHMLSGLSANPQTAFHCFNFLKANSPSLGGGGASAAISLDHFFLSLRQYYLGLRQEAGSKQTPTGCAITPQELEGLQSVLALVRNIAGMDEGARVVMYENQTWLPVASFFGLLGCAVPRSLKAQLLLTLAAFAKSPEIAASMWHTLEMAQVLSTVPSGGASVGGGGTFGQPANPEGSIQVELEEMESQAEEYPLTQAFLVFLESLISVPIPRTLGAGHRIPGFEPYLEFVRDLVFLKFDSRAYHNSEEKWQVASLALDVLFKLLSSHEISLEDFTDQSYELPGGALAQVPKPPGHSLLVHMMNDSQLLRKILAVLDECCSLLCDTTQPSREVARCALLCLKMVEGTLSRQEQFLQVIRQHTQRVLVTPLDQLLLGINPRTGQADHLLIIARYVSLSGCSPELALAAIQTLYWVSRSHKAAREVVTAITSDKSGSVEVLRGFVEHLEWEGPESATTREEEDSSEESHSSEPQVRRAVQISALKLLSSCVDGPAPNIAHFLLGFETGSSKYVSETTLQDPGVLGSARTCLHSILSLMEHGRDPRNPIGCHYRNPALAELCYKVIYQLCSNRELSTPTLRYLRNNHDFFLSQLARFPLSVSSLGSDDTEETLLNSRQISLLHQQAWLLKSVAIELRMTSLTHQRSHTQRIVNLLLSEQSSTSEQLGNGATESQFKSDFDFLQEGRRKILILLDMVDFSDMPLPFLELQLFDQSAVEQAIASCEMQDEASGLRYTNVKLLHRTLMNELNALQGAAVAGQKQSILEEIHEILSMLVQRNRVRENGHAHQMLLEAWHQVVEITLHTLVQDSLRVELKVAVLFELIQDLLLKVEGCEESDLMASVHGVVLMLLAHLRQTVSSTDDEQSASLLSPLYSGPLQAIMKGLVESVLRAPSSSQSTRAFLYGSLLYYLLMTKQEGGSYRKKATSLWQADSAQDSLSAASLQILNSFGEPLMESVCRDACSGHDVTRMLSLSLLDAIAAIDWQGLWLKFLTVKGYLQTLCTSLQWEDQALQKMLHPLPEALKALYIYESKMAFLTRLAHTPAGAQELVSLNCPLYLSECRFVDMRPSRNGDSLPLGHPHVYPTSTTGGFIPTVADRYRQMFLPVLKFLLALLTCPGPQQREASTQVTALIGAHSDLFATILRDHVHHISIATLHELALVTALISRSGIGHDWSVDMTSGKIRIQRLMLTLLPHYCSRQSWRGIVQEVVSGEEGEGDKVDPIISEEALLLVQQICANVVSYCRVAMTIGGREFSSPYSRILLTPDLSAGILSSQGKEAFPPAVSATTAVSSQSPSLGVIIKHLKECTEGYALALETYQQHKKKVETVGSLTAEDIRQLLPSSSPAEKLSLPQQQGLARKRLHKLTTLKQQELQQFAYIIESQLYVLWRHLQYYLVHCKPSDFGGELGVAGAVRVGMRRMEDHYTAGTSSTATDSTFDLSALSDGVRLSDLEQLKTDAGKCISDALLKKLLDMEETQLQANTEMRVGFVQALVRRIKRLMKLRAAAKPIL